MSAPLFSVLIANYNNGRYIEDAINSVLQQTYTNWEIVIVDDASTDNSLQILEKHQSDSRIKFFVNEQNRGCGYTKRRCAELASGEVCGFVDPDDAITENAVELMIQAHLANSEVSMVYSRFWHCNEKLEKVSESFYQTQITAPDTYLTVQTGKVSHFVSFKRAAYNKTEGISAEYTRAVDQDLYLKLEEAGEILFINHALYYYREHLNGISNFHNTDKAFAWGILAKVDACRRRKISVEQVLPLFIKSVKTTTEFYESSTDYRLGKALLAPYRFLRYQILGKWWSNS